MKLSRSAILPHSAMQMFEVVSDIESYPSFLFACDDSKIISVKQISEHVEEVTAKVKVSYSKLNLQFTTSNLNTLGESISLRLVDGPFSSMSGVWTFEALSKEACKVSLDMNFTFDNFVMNKIFSTAFGTLIDKQFDAFQARAAQLYGKS